MVKKKIEGVPRTISLSREHSDFVDGESRQFNLSKFVRVSLDAYIDYVRRLRKQDDETNV